MPSYARVEFLPSVARAVESLGYSSRRLFGKFALSVEQAESTHGFIPATTYLRLLEEAARYTGDAGFGISATINEPLTFPGALGYLAQNLPSLEASWKAIEPFHSSALSCKIGGLDDAGADIDFWCKLTWPEPAEVTQSSLRCAAYMLNLLRHFSGADETDFQIVLPERLADRADNLREKGIEARFQGDRIVLRTPRHVAKKVRPGGDPVLAGILSSFLDLSRPPPVGDLLVAHVEEEIRHELYNGPPSIERIGERLGIGIRTLQRRLNKNGEVFSEMVDKCRYGLAQHFLRQDDLSIGEIAVLLGYANQSAFTRAFVRWSDTTPRNYRFESRLQSGMHSGGIAFAGDGRTRPVNTS